MARKRSKTRQAVQESFYGGTSFPYDRHAGFFGSQGRVFPWWGFGFGATVQDKKDGAYKPFYWTDFDLSQIWGQARRIATANSLGVGLVETITDFVVGTGWEYEAQPAKGYEQDATAISLTRAVNRITADFRDLNSWPLYEAEAVWKFVVEGECFQRFTTTRDGMLEVRPVEAEQVRQPFDRTFDEYAFGLRHRPGDATVVEEFAIQYDPDGQDCEYVPADEINHGKANVPMVVKRGLSDFFSSLEAFAEVGKLLRNMRINAATVAAMAYVEELPPAMPQAGLDAMNAKRADLSNPMSGFVGPTTGRQKDYQTIEPGQVIQTRSKFQPPPLASNTQNFVAVAQAAMRALGVRWGMPEFMISGDASNNNYASIFVSGAPFVRRVERYQKTRYEPFFKRAMWTSVKVACEAGRLGRIDFADVQRLVDIHCTPPAVAISDRAADAAADLADLQAGVTSKQIVVAKRGLDYAKVRADLQADPVNPPQQPAGMPAMESRLRECDQGPNKGKPGPCPSGNHPTIGHAPEVTDEAHALHATVSSHPPLASVTEMTDSTVDMVVEAGKRKASAKDIQAAVVAQRAAVAAALTKAAEAAVPDLARATGKNPERVRAVLAGVAKSMAGELAQRQGEKAREAARAARAQDYRPGDNPRAMLAAAEKARLTSHDVYDAFDRAMDAKGLLTDRDGGDELRHDVLDAVEPHFLGGKRSPALREVHGGGIGRDYLTHGFPDAYHVGRQPLGEGRIARSGWQLLECDQGPNKGKPGPCPGSDAGNDTAPTPTSTTAAPSSGAKTFGKSKARVEPKTPYFAEETDAVREKVLGKKFPAEHVASLVGAPDEAVVKLNFDKSGKKLIVTIHHSDFTAERHIYRKGKAIVVKNELIEVNPASQGKGVGSDVFGRQVEQCREMGVTAIECHAAHLTAEGKPGFNGYYTWPRLGYDAPLDSLKSQRPDVHRAVKKQFPQAQTVLDVMSTPEGRSWWKANGSDIFDASFDLTPGSRSLAVHDAYQQARGQK